MSIKGWGLASGAPASGRRRPGSAGERETNEDKNADKKGPTFDLLTTRSTWIIVGMIVLLGALFYFLLVYQQKMRSSNYFAAIYQDGVRDSELLRLTARTRAKWVDGGYLQELVLELSPRAKEWMEMEKNRRPRPSDPAKTLAAKLERTYQLSELESSMEYPDFVRQRDRGTANPFGRTPMPGDGFMPPGLPDHRRPRSVPEAEEQEWKDTGDFQKLLFAFSKEVEGWIRRARGIAETWYQEDLAQDEQGAKAQADKAMQIDFSAWSRGPEFVLEFTAVVVIIFAAVILGIGGRLSSEQIGTLLAAIAGYVLGKGTARSRAEAPQEQGQDRTQKRPVTPAQALTPGPAAPGGRGPSSGLTSKGAGQDSPAERHAA